MKSGVYIVSLVFFLLAFLSNSAQEKRTDTIFLYDTISYLVRPKFKLGGKEDLLLVFSDPNLKDIMFKQTPYSGDLPKTKPIEIRSYFWSKDFYKTARRKTPIPGFFKHFKDKSILYKEGESAFLLEPRLYSVD